MPAPARLAIAPVVALIALVMLLASGPASAASDPTVRATLAATGGTSVRLELANTGTTTARVPAWLTGARGIAAPILTATRDGSAVAYTGMLAKRDEASPADEVAIAPGGSASWSLDVATAYALPTGDTTVAYDTTMPDGTRITSNAVVVAAQAAAPTAPAGARTTAQAAGIGALAIAYTGCDAGEQNQIAAALAAADTYVANANTYFTAGRAGARYQLWFGTYLSGRWSTAQAHYTNIKAITGGTSAAFTCHDIQCVPGVYAFVYPTAPYMVYVCGGFWSAAVTGTDSRAGTLIHEISHFTVLGGTDDYVYGQAGAQSLAATNPANAVMNADNHEYFAENTPATSATYSTAASNYDLGTVATGASSASTSITVTSAGTVALTPSGASVTGDFAITANTCTGATVAPAGTCRIDVAFTPTAVGTRTGTLSVLGNLDAAPAAVTLSGTGTALAVPPAANPVASAPAPVQGGTDPAPAPQATEVTTPVPPRALKASSSCRTTGTCAVVGTVPASATAVTVRASRKGGSARGTCRITGRGAARAYACSIRLGKGTWTVTTEATGPGGVVARSTKKVVRSGR